MKDLRSLSLPNMKPSGGQSPYILTPGSEKAEHSSLGRRESVDLLVSTVRPPSLPLLPLSTPPTPVRHVATRWSHTSDS